MLVKRHDGFINFAPQKSEMTPFTEKQRFTQWWLWALLIAALVIPLSATLIQSRAADSGITGTDIAIGSLFPSLILLFFLIMHLRTRIDESGIRYRFVPIHGKEQHIKWDEIEKVYTRTYSPLKEYGGWGIRTGFGKTGKAYNISGNKGIQVELKDGKRVLLGTCKPSEVDNVLKALVQQKVVSAKAISA
jgi:hypothetical protein